MDRRRYRWPAIGLHRAATLALLAALLAVPARHYARAQGAPAIEILNPAPGATVTTDDIAVQVRISNFTVDCAQAGRPDAEGVGHIHVMLDGMTMATLTNFYCQEQFTIPGDGITPGKHTLIVDLATNTHVDMVDTARMVEFDFQPANPKPLPAASDQGEPGVELVSPADGAEVLSTFTVEVKPINFIPSEALEGKQNVPGYGHYHVFVDTDMAMGMMDMSATPAEPMDTPAGMGGTPEGAMHTMAMAGMVLMPGSNTFELDLTAWGPGKHTIWIEPVQNDHTQFETFGHVEFTVTVK